MLCQQKVENSHFHCRKCTINGPSKCDPEGCVIDTSWRIATGLNRSTYLCEHCQRYISDYLDKYENYCRNCTINGPGKCDRNGCFGRTGLNFEDLKCGLCQVNISGHGLNCTSCNSNGADKCDPDGCPPTTYFDNQTKMCETKFECRYML